jgi:hypothetical protein
MGGVFTLMSIGTRIRSFFFYCSISIMALAVWSGGAPLLAAEADLRRELAGALAREDVAAVGKIVAAERAALGEKAGIPDEPDQFIPIPKEGRWLTPEEARTGFARVAPLLDKVSWWRIGLDPTTLAHPLREPASVIAGCVAACRGKLDGAEDSLARAKAAAAFLMWAQGQAGAGVFPFPAARGAASTRAFLAGDKLLAQIEKEGRLDDAIHHGWVVEDLGDGGLQFDNGECGLALLELYELTRDARYLDSARRAADWAVKRPLAPNWNYNSFSVALLARFFEVTGERRYLAAAKQKAMLGVIPGQIKDGPMVGRWIDPHNAKPAYHYIMLRALADLAIALPKDDPGRVDVVSALRLGLKARNKDFLERGAPNKDKAMETLLIVNRFLSQEPDFLRDTQSAEALEALGKLVSEEARRGRAPLDPRGWGEFLEFVIGGAERRR